MFECFIFILNLNYLKQVKKIAKLLGAYEIDKLYYFDCNSVKNLPGSKYDINFDDYNINNYRYYKN